MKLRAITAGLLLLAAGSSAFGQAVNCNGATGHVQINGGPAYIDCGSAPAPPPPVPPPPVPPTGCDASQTSYSGLSRQCFGAVYWPQKPSLNFSGNLVSVDSVLHGTWGKYTAAGGNSFTISIATGQYISLALTATDVTHGLKFGANQTFGAGGSLWVSATPGGVPLSQMCAQSGNPQVQLYPFAGSQWCAIPLNQTVYINWSDGQPIGYGVY